MQAVDFTSNSPGRLVPTIQGALAFVPDDLPPRFEVGRIAFELAETMQAMGELKGAARRLQNPYILIRPLQRNEALTSSAMEGTFTTEDNLLLVEAGARHARDEQTREVANYLTALSNAINMLNQLPISHRILTTAHSVLLSGLSAQRGATKRPGEYKREQNWIGGHTIHLARFVPPPPSEAQKCMDQLEAYINRDGRDVASSLIDMALVHYQIEAIHPFADGNGRIGRMLVSLMAMHSGLLETPVLYLSPVLERQKSRYIDLMYSVSASGNWTDWISFFLKCVKESCQETIAAIDRIIALHQRFRDETAAASKSSNAISLVDYLFEQPVVTITEASKRLSVTYAAARNTIERLVQIGILTEVEGVYPKAFISVEIVLATRPTPIPSTQNNLFGGI